MKALCFFIIMFFVGISGANAASFSVYPGAVRSETETQKLNFGKPANLPYSTAFVTSDAFEKVKAFYQGAGKEFIPPKNLKEKKTADNKTAYFIFDKARNPDSSSQWVLIQEPFIIKTKVKKWFKTIDVFTTNTIIILNEKAKKK